MTQTKKYYETDIKKVSNNKQDFLVKSYNKQRAKSFFHKLGNSLGLVVVTLPLAGLFAAIGGIVMSKGDTEAAYTVGLILADLGQTVLSNLGALFMLAIIIGFTGNKGMAVYTGLIGYIAFVGFSIPFIRYDGLAVDNASLKADTFSIWFWKDLNVSTQLANVLGLGQSAVLLDGTETHGEFARMSWEGIKTLNTGVLGGIFLGFIYASVYNRFKDLKLPTMLAFFEGEKFVALLMIVLAPVVASAFIIVWPGVNFVLEKIGVGLSYLPYGIDAFFEGMITRLLLPFESHPAFYGPLWWTSAGGQLSDHQVQIIEAMMHRVVTGDNVGIGQEMNYYDNTILVWAKDMNIHDYLDSVLKGGTFNGPEIFAGVKDKLGATPDQLAEISENLDVYAALKWSTAGDQLMTMELLNNNPGFDMRDAWAVNLKVTRFISGGYGLLMFIIPTIGFAMWSTLDKERRSQKFGLYFGAILTCFILGITEPIEFMFAFTAPLIYFLIYAPFYGLFFGAATLFQVKLGSTFSQGLIDYIVNAIIPTVTRDNEGVAQTNIWVPLVIGIVGAAIAFPFFRFIFIKFEFAAPGSLAAEEGVGVSQSKYSRVKPEYDGLLAYFGGLSNVSSFKLEGNTGAKVQVKRLDLIQNNEFTIENLVKSTQEGSSFIIEMKEAKEGMEYLSLIADMINSIDKNEDFKAMKKVEAKTFADQMKEAKATNSSTEELKANRLKNIKVFNIEKRRFEQISKVNAKWEYKEENLLNTSDIDHLKYEYKLTKWQNEHYKELAVLKANYKADLQLNSEDKAKVETIKAKFLSEKEQLKPNKEKINSDKVVYKEKLKAMKAAKKEAYAKDRTSLVSAIKNKKTKQKNK